MIVTRPKGQSQNFINRLTNKGFTAFDLPGIHIAPAMDQAKAIEMLSEASQYNYCLFTSPNSVKFAKQLQFDFQNVQAFISIGSGTERALKPYIGQRKVITAPKPYTSEALVKTLQKKGMKDQSVLIISGEGGRRLLDTAINEMGGQGQYCDVYRRIAPENPDIEPILKWQTADLAHKLYLVVSSQESFTNLLPFIENHGLKPAINGVFVGSERLKSIVESAGFSNIIVAKSALENDLWQAIDTTFSYQAVTIDAPLTITPDSNKELSMSQEQEKNEDISKESVVDSTNAEETASEATQSPEKTNLSSQKPERKNRRNHKNLAKTEEAFEKIEEKIEEKVNETTHDVNEKIASLHASQESSSSKKGGQSLTYLALILALGGLGLGGFGYYKGIIEPNPQITALSSAIESDKTTISNLQNDISQLQESLKSLQAQAEKSAQVDNSSLQNQVTVVAQNHETLNNALASSSKGLQSQIDDLKTTQKTLITKTNQIDNIASVSNQAITIANGFDKKLAAQELEQQVVLNQAKELISTIKNITDLEMLRTAEVDYLLKVALQKVEFDNDYKTAETLLSTALDRLSQINGINFSETKSLLEANIAELKTLQPIDIPAITGKLEKVMALMQQSPLKSDSALIDLKNQIFKQGAVEGETWTEKLTSSLKHLVVIEDKRTEVPELMAKEDRFFLLQNIQLELTAAKVALLQDQFTVFDNSLKTVQTWVKTYFDEDNADVREAIQQLQWLLDAKLDVTPPNIKRTLTDFEATLRAYKGA